MSLKMGTACCRYSFVCAERRQIWKECPKEPKNTLWHHHRAQYCPDYCSSSPTDISPPPNGLEQLKLSLHWEGVEKYLCGYNLPMLTDLA